MSTESTSKYIYKILPVPAQDARYAFPIPIPSDHDFFVSDLDAQDGYMHSSTAQQIEATLSRFYADSPSVVLLKIELAKLIGPAGKTVKWEAAGSGVFPHLYGKLQGSDVESFEEIANDAQGWSKSLDGLKQAGWLLD